MAHAKAVDLGNYLQDAFNGASKSIFRTERNTSRFFSYVATHPLLSLSTVWWSIVEFWEQRFRVLANLLGASYVAIVLGHNLPRLYTDNLVQLATQQFNFIVMLIDQHTVGHRPPNEFFLFLANPLAGVFRIIWNYGSYTAAAMDARLTPVWFWVPSELFFFLLLVEIIGSVVVGFVNAIYTIRVNSTILSIKQITNNGETPLLKASDVFWVKSDLHPSGFVKAIKVAVKGEFIFVAAPPDWVSPSPPGRNIVFEGAQPQSFRIANGKPPGGAVHLGVVREETNTIFYHGWAIRLTDTRFAVPKHVLDDLQGMADLEGALAYVLCNPSDPTRFALVPRGECSIVAVVDEVDLILFELPMKYSSIAAIKMVKPLRTKPTALSVYDGSGCEVAPAAPMEKKKGYRSHQISTQGGDSGAAVFDPTTKATYGMHSHMDTQTGYNYFVPMGLILAVSRMVDDPSAPEQDEIYESSTSLADENFASGKLDEAGNFLADDDEAVLAARHAAEEKFGPGTTIKIYTKKGSRRAYIGYGPASTVISERQTYKKGKGGKLVVTDSFNRDMLSPEQQEDYDREQEAKLKPELVFESAEVSAAKDLLCFRFESTGNDSEPKLTQAQIFDFIALSQYPEKPTDCGNVRKARRAMAMRRQQMIQAAIAEVINLPTTWENKQKFLGDHLQSRLAILREKSIDANSLPNLLHVWSRDWCVAVAKLEKEHALQLEVAHILSNLKGTVYESPKTLRQKMDDYRAKRIDMIKLSNSDPNCAQESIDFFCAAWDQAVDNVVYNVDGLKISAEAAKSQQDIQVELLCSASPAGPATDIVLQLFKEAWARALTEDGTHGSQVTMGYAIRDYLPGGDIAKAAVKAVETMGQMKPYNYNVVAPSPMARGLILQEGVAAAIKSKLSVMFEGACTSAPDQGKAKALAAPAQQQNAKPQNKTKDGTGSTKPVATASAANQPRSAVPVPATTYVQDGTANLELKALMAKMTDKLNQFDQKLKSASKDASRTPISSQPPSGTNPGMSKSAKKRATKKEKSQQVTQHTPLLTPAQ